MALGLILIKFDFFCRKVKRQRSAFYKLVTWSILLLLCIVIGTYRFIVTSNHPLAVHKTYIYIEPFSSYYRQTNHSQIMVDWNDHEAIRRDAKKTGDGEQGLPTFIDGQDPKLEEKLILENGHNVLVSDMISLNRAIPDFRNDDCKTRQYLKDLPKVSVIIPFFDEHISTLLRTIHSVINRTPKALLKEIILVNDDSHKHYEQLELHITANKWEDIVRMLEMDEQSGPIWSRLAGARLATGDIFLFMDCHVEVGYNYLPPLIEPIARNYRVVTVPTLDSINKYNYEITEVAAARTVFDWHFHAQRIPLRKKDLAQKADEPYFTPIIYGSTYAISAKFFWELKPDSGLITHGADFLEMSFKVNLCGGMALEHPCSRVAHLYRRFHHEKHNYNDIDFKAANNKRVAEIWLDEYKESLYSRHPERYHRVEIKEEDIAEQIQLKETLQCLPMSYFFEKLAPDMLERYPLEEYKHFASGAIRLLERNDSCIEISGDADYGEEARLEIAKCGYNMKHPHEYQFFILRHFRDIQIRGRSDCIVNSIHGNSFTYRHCHYNQADQYFRYNIDTHQIYWGPKRNNMCLDVDEENNIIITNVCDSKKALQKFVFGSIHLSMLKDWLGNGAKILDEKEIEDLKNEAKHKSHH
ncbi:hypothetical protein PVAND_001860 [Polypedilum vanderplanki]|uniref:Polypeptide N-acetylgalactosaminyltransferase n=1 Tax=Polypedilum vanderplanki TaxID=319348 RepID=A0A9J6BPN2_POLVA|nr:hypothetical protein PVAND_001860 [Polypedilum vanderplanki]